MVEAVYRIVEHDGGWAYKLGDVFSETFPSREQAEAAATRVAAEQRLPGEDETISWQDERGAWHDESERGSDRPDAYVERAGAPVARPRGWPAYARPSRPATAPREGVSLQTLVFAATVGCFLAVMLARRRQA